ncbi:hypothetical protein LMH87_011996 [Akanthomyces muscarius]|uniref:INO80 complex subunit B-like conserved region domain-containing protein n=1 Tax=Akanthomyces muscarius TaxID=2231603 RepID=A0A9W8QAU1_AKAMU|nr:hypothetical protein LMH87_011996 [Akanthomyces muscarius]KAJ4151285.1 hypothetical protein LMH87_011996 [Akanthomyces muscarius]
MPSSLATLQFHCTDILRLLPTKVWRRATPISRGIPRTHRTGDSPVPSRRSGRSAVYRDAPSSPESGSMPSRSRQSARGGRRSEQFDGGEIVTGKRNRGTKKSYVVDSSPDDEDEDDMEDEVEVDLDEEDAEGEDEVDMDAEGEDLDDDGDVHMDAAPPPRRNKVTSIKVSRSANPRSAARAAASRIVADDDDDDDELSEPDSDLGAETMGMGDETMAEEDAEGEEIEVAGDGEEDEEEEEEEEDEEDEDDEQDEEEDAEGEADVQELNSDEDGSRAGTPDLAKMTKRQRARFDEQPQEYMKLSDEVQAKKVFTAEELSMRRQEMARRRRNLSEKRNEEVKMETINKLLKKQAPKTSKKGARGNSPGAGAKPAETLIRRRVWAAGQGQQRSQDGGRGGVKK